MSTPLEDAVKNWIRAEYLFRCGPDAYRPPTDQWLTDAEDALRKALTEQTDLAQAAKAIGVDVPEPVVKKPKGVIIPRKVLEEEPLPTLSDAAQRSPEFAKALRTFFNEEEAEAERRRLAHERRRRLEE